MGMRTASTTSLMIVHGALPVNRCERVRGCTVMASTPSASAIWATSTAFRCSSSQPPRILTVNGHGERLLQRAQDQRRARHVAHQRRALALAGDLRHGAAHVEVHDVGAEDLAALGRAREEVGVLAEELHRERPLLRIVGGDGIGMGMVREERRGVHLFGGREAAAAFPHDQPERRIGDARHRRHARERAHLDGTDLHGPEYTPRPSRCARGLADSDRRMRKTRRMLSASCWGNRSGGGVLSKVKALEVGRVDVPPAPGNATPHGQLTHHSQGGPVCAV